MKSSESKEELIQSTGNGELFSEKPEVDRLLTDIEKKFLLHAERGDTATVRRLLEEYKDKKEELDINCVDPLNRSALIAAIENENIDLIRVLLEMGIEVKDTLLHAIKEEYVEAVEVLLEWEEKIHEPGKPYSWEAIEQSKATFTPDITPLILAAHTNNYEIIKILLDRGATLPTPHDIRCGCDECILSSETDSLRHSQARLNAYKALSASSLIALSSKDPLLTAFELSWELRRLSFCEAEFRAEYQEMRAAMEDFATALLDHARTSHELETMLNYNPDGAPWEPGERQTLERLKMAIKYKQKKFVAHPNVQQLLASIWYDGLPGFRRKSMFMQLLEVIKLGSFFPFYSLIYMVAPNSAKGLFMKKPFVKFIFHSSSYIVFLMLLGMASQRVEFLLLEWFGNKWMKGLLADWKKRERGSLPGLVEGAVMIYVLGWIYNEVRALWTGGLKEYITDLWNIVDFITNCMYMIWICLRFTAVFIVKREAWFGLDPYIPREKWHTFDPMLLSEGAFAAGMIFSFLKLVHIFSLNPHLGPLQISLGRIIIDILKFFFIYTLVLFAFGCGMNQLMWYYADLEKDRCYSLTDPEIPDFDGNEKACSVWRRFANLFETSQSLFWASFGLVDLTSFDLAGIKSFTRFWALLLFGSYSVINIIVLLNMLIAMMSNSYQIISERSDIEWKFARSRLWISYFDDGDTLPAPFNLMPTLKTLTRKLFCRKRPLTGGSLKKKTKAKAEEEHNTVMHILLRRHITAEQRKRDEFGITEDDVIEIRQDISSLRYELIDILRTNGMKTPNTIQDQTAVSKKGKIMERRLIKDFHIGLVEGILKEDFTFAKNSSDVLKKIARVIGQRVSIKKKSKKDWNEIVRKTTIDANPIGTTEERKERQTVRRYIIEKNAAFENMDQDKLLQYNPKLSTVAPAARVAYAKFKIGKIRQEFADEETEINRLSLGEPKTEVLNEKKVKTSSDRSSSIVRPRPRSSKKSLNQEKEIVAETNKTSESSQECPAETEDRTGSAVNDDVDESNVAVKEATVLEDESGKQQLSRDDSKEEEEEAKMISANGLEVESRSVPEEDEQRKESGESEESVAAEKAPEKREEIGSADIPEGPEKASTESSSEIVKEPEKLVVERYTAPAVSPLRRPSPKPSGKSKISGEIVSALPMMSVSESSRRMNEDEKRHVRFNMDRGFSKMKITMPPLSKALALEEKKYLLAVERGDLATVRKMLQLAHTKNLFNMNCVDPLGRGAVSLAIDGENLEMLELLLVIGIEAKDALLQAINVEFVEAVELLLEYEELIHKEGEPYSWEKIDWNVGTFPPDITPIILAAHRNNYEIIKILLERGATLPMPHDVKCGCEDCIRQSEEDSLRFSLSRINQYRALSSPSLIALSSNDPILTAFQLSWELRNLAFSEQESKSDYMELRRQCQKFAVDLLNQTRSSQELAVILNHDPESLPYEDGEHMKLARLELAIHMKQKTFVAHPNVQQLLAALWYEGLPGFRRKSLINKLLEIVKVATLFPFYCLLYMIAPGTKTGKLMRKPFMKFLIHASSYLFFLFILILVSQRADRLIIELLGTDAMHKEMEEQKPVQRGNSPTVLEWIVVSYVLGFIWEEVMEVYYGGLDEYVRDMWNVIDLTRDGLYVLVIILRAVAYVQQTAEISADASSAFIPREEWDDFDPQLISEGLFAAANIFSALKLVKIFSINPHLGPLQISVGRMVIDIIKFFFIYSLVLFAFACGLNQLLWYFAELERRKCYVLPNGQPDWQGNGDACMKWRRFGSLFESSQSLFWASFGMIGLENFELSGIKSYTRFWGLLMFGSYSVINIIVLLNLLIAMMSNSYAVIEEHSDTEWKFARTRLWMSYFEESSTLPPPFNIVPTPKLFMKWLGLRKKDKLRKLSSKRKENQEKERDYRYTAVMRALVWRYVSEQHRQIEETPVNEDHINEVKGEITSSKFDVLEVLAKNGFDTSCVESSTKERAVLGKKMRIWERRLMKDFHLVPVAGEEELEVLPPENESPLSRFRRIAKLAIVKSTQRKWDDVVSGICQASQIGRSHTREALKNQQNLQKAMAAAKKYISHASPVDIPIETIPQTPDLVGGTIKELLQEFQEETKYLTTPKRSTGILKPVKTEQPNEVILNISTIPTPRNSLIRKSPEASSTQTSPSIATVSETYSLPSAIADPNTDPNRGHQPEIHPPAVAITSATPPGEQAKPIGVTIPMPPPYKRSDGRIISRQLKTGWM